MKRTLGISGYTIIEVMIVLAVSGGLLASVAAMISGQQRNTEFTVATRDVEARLQDFLNDVETGVSANGGEQNCTASSVDADIAIGDVAAEQGTNGACVLLGKAIQFYTNAPSGLLSQYSVIGIAGKRQYRDGDGKVQAVSSLDAAKTRAYYKDGSTKNTVENSTLLNGLQLEKVRYYMSDMTTRDQTALAVIGKMGVKGDVAGTSFDPDGGARIGRIDYNDKSVTSINAAFVGKLTNLKSVDFTSVLGVVVCLNQGAGSRVSAVTIGLQPKGDGTAGVQASGQRLKTDAYFDQDAGKLGCTS